MRNLDVPYVKIPWPRLSPSTERELVEGGARPAMWVYFSKYDCTITPRPTNAQIEARYRELRPAYATNAEAYERISVECDGRLSPATIRDIVKPPHRKSRS